MRENELEKVLKEQGQEHIWEAYQKLDEAGKEKLAAQVEKVDWSMVAMAGNEELAQEEAVRVVHHQEEAVQVVLHQEEAVQVEIMYLPR